MSIPSRFCKTCGNKYKPITVAQTHCIKCIQDQPYDLVIDCGTYHAEIHSELLPRYKRTQLLNNIRALGGK